MSILSKIFNLVNSSSNGYHKNKHRGSSYYKNTIDQNQDFWIYDVCIFFKE